jgi:phosphoglycerate dehydrogenase-like enzyme
MDLSRPPLVITFELSEKRKAIVADALSGASAVVYLTELDEAARAEALRNTGALLTFNTSKELRSGEAKLLAGARLIQFMIAGVDFIPLGELPEGVPVATNGGGYAESMAEHALAMALAAAKRLVLEHENLKRGQFNQFERNRMLAGGLCGIFGFGGIGAATARLMRGIGMRVHAINRHGRTDQQVDWIATPERLNELLEAADVLVISAPLTRATYGLIGAAELRRMKDDAILVNLPVGKSCRKGRCMTTWSRTRPSPPASMPGGLNRYATESFASINRFSTCRMSSPHRIIRDRATARTTSACAGQLRTVAWP